MKKIVYLIILICVFPHSLLIAQTDKSEARAKGREAVKLMDEGKFEESIILLDQAAILDPSEITYPYEKAYAYYASKKFNKAIEILDNLKNSEQAPDRLFQLLGNAYDLIGKSDIAMQTYDLGLKKFPNSGILYLEKGNIFYLDKKYDEALDLYEKGIEVDPKFPSNYYRAALLYCSSTERVWGMIYGEIFLNLEKNSKRTEEISKLLYDTYKKAITFDNENSGSIAFSQMAEIKDKDIKDSTKIKLPFGIGAYEPCYFPAILLNKPIDLNSLNEIRALFLKTYFQKQLNVSYPNILFDYQKKIEEAGQLEAYNYWLLQKGDAEAFYKWQKENIDKWNKFREWIYKNPLRLDNFNRFYRKQY